MVKFIAVDPDEVPNFRDTHRGRVSYPILKSFLETGLPLAQLDRTGMQQGLQSLNSCLTSYIRNHKLPIKMFTRRGEIYMVRLDIDDEGNVIPDWQEREAGNVLNSEDVPYIDPNEVEKRFVEEKDLVTK